MNAIYIYSKCPIDGIILVAESLSSRNYKLTITLSHEDNCLQSVLPCVKRIYTSSKNIDVDLTSFFNEELYNDVVSKNFLLLSSILERGDLKFRGAIDKECLLIKEFCYIYSIIIENKLNLFLFSKQPETLREYLMYLIAKKLGLEVFSTINGVLGHTRTISSDIFSPIVDKNNQINSNIFNIRNHEEVLSQNSLRQIDLIKSRSSGIFFVRNTDIKALLNSIKSVITRYPLRKGYIFLTKLFFCYNEYVKYFNFSDKKNKSKTFLFALHYQPELTTMPLAKKFNNQARAILELSKFIESDDVILIKEHPGTFSDQSRTNLNYRSCEFYKFISQIPNAYFVNDNLNSSYLIDNVDVIVTLSGSAGIEGLLRGKKIIHFGWASYMNCPNSLYWHNITKTTFNAFIFSDNRPLVEVTNFLSLIESVCNIDDFSFYLSEDQSLIDKMAMHYAKCISHFIAKVHNVN